MIGLNIKPYCTCYATGTWKPQDGFTLDVESGWWVHGRCRKPSRMNYERQALGLHQIPQPRKSEDIYETELRLETKKEVQVELDDLGWQDDDDEGWELYDE